MKGYALLAAACVAFAAHMADAMDGMAGGGGGPKVGGWTKTKATHELKEKLVAALTKGNDNYAEGVTTRLCVTQLKYVDQQVVAGTNYRFHIMGCDVGSAFARVGKCAGADANCQPRSYAVKVFDQPWTDTLQVTEITLEGETASEKQKKSEGMGSVPGHTIRVYVVSEEEKRLIDAWLKQNDLNRYGDPKGTAYTGGTPLFDERTGQVTDRIAYIVGKHPDRPWLPTEAPAMAMVRASPLNFAASEAGASGGAFNDTYVKSLAVFGSLAIAIGAIAFVKARRTATRRFNYDSVRRSEL